MDELCRRLGAGPHLLAIEIQEKSYDIGAAGQLGRRLFYDRCFWGGRYFAATAAHETHGKEQHAENQHGRRDPGVDLDLLRDGRAVLEQGVEIPGAPVERRHAIRAGRLEHLRQALGPDGLDVRPADKMGLLVVLVKYVVSRFPGAIHRYDLPVLEKDNFSIQMVFCQHGGAHG